ncbi:MAG TPA: glycosyltransferase [Candidatus Eisenbacteria bacterium]|jgi:glycosyltransferase involved in cell wall biosynthesis
MKVLVVTNMYPSAARPDWGAFVRSQVESLGRLGVENHLYEIEGWRSASRYARAFAELPAVARRERADLVHAHYGLSGAAALRVGAPLVVSFCGDDLLGRPDASGSITAKSRVLVQFSLLAARRADAVIVKTEEMRRRLPPLPDVEVIPNGVDLARFAPVPRAEARRRLGWEADGAVLLFAARPDEARKNFPLALEVERRLRERGHGVRLVAVHGRPQEEMALAMAAADVLLLPSWHEGSVNVVKEAMAATLPVVAAPVGDCAERLAGVSPGAVVAREPAGFAAAAEAALRAGTRSNGRERIAPLELSAVARRVLAVYERARARHGARTGEGRR